ncbi:MAG: hypothetical protein ACK4OF_04410 [Aquificaceae bacterium]
MVGNRGRYTTEKHKVRGIALISAIIVSVLVLILLSSLYFMLTRLFETAESTRTYSSAREAAVAGVNYAITSGIFDTIENAGVCPDGQQSNATCCRLNLRFKLRGSDQEYSNTVDVCFLGSFYPPGYSISGVAYSTPGKKIFSIISEVRDPQGLNTARIEAVYMP